MSEVVQSWSLQQDGPVSSVLLFPLPPEPHGAPEDSWNLLVTSALEAAVVYRNLLEQGLGSPQVFPSGFSLIPDPPFPQNSRNILEQ
ncbi:KICSTOR complex protein kaptin, partial [Corapipo altera]|uniref:KICSTOR complex protein kaptin n=1 Tax=Corapipo altera TaxID=415028 RepID=UPI000FD6AF0B